MTKRASELVKAILPRLKALKNKKLYTQTAISEPSCPTCAETARSDSLRDVRNLR